MLVVNLCPKIPAKSKNIKEQGGTAMEISIVRRLQKNGNLKSRLEYPACGIEKTDEFYRQLAEGCVSEEFTTNLSCRLCCSSENAYSLYFDLRYYKGSELVFFKRFSDNRKQNGLCIMPEEVFVHPAMIKKRFVLKSTSDWYFLDGKITVFKNTFRPGDGQGIRKSAESRFIVERFPDMADIRPTFTDCHFVN
mgnify:CR=1 FL=1